MYVIQYMCFLIFFFCLNTGIKPDVTIYNGLLSVYIQNNYRFNPLEILEQMQQKMVEPNRVRLGLCVDVSFNLTSKLHFKTKKKPDLLTGQHFTLKCCPQTYM